MKRACGRELELGGAVALPRPGNGETQHTQYANTEKKHGISTERNTFRWKAGSRSSGGLSGGSRSGANYEI